jgi:hypothetical protein
MQQWLQQVALIPTQRLTDTIHRIEIHTMTKWEYCTVSNGDVYFCRPSGLVKVNRPKAEKDVGAVIARLGEEGWEAFAYDSSTAMWTFKRPLI